MNKSEVTERVESISSNIDKISGALEKAHANHADAKVKLERTNLELAHEEEEMTRLYQRKAWEITQNSAWEESSIDPRVGEKTESWGQQVIDRLVGADPEWNETIGGFYLRQQAHAAARGTVHEAQGRVDGLTAELNGLHSKATLLAAYIGAFTE